MRKLIAVAVLAAAALTGCASTHHAARTCTFDGGGTITAGNAAKTTEGTVWKCTEDGQLIRIR